MNQRPRGVPLGDSPDRSIGLSFMCATSISRRDSTPPSIIFAVLAIVAIANRRFAEKRHTEMADVL